MTKEITLVYCGYQVKKHGWSPNFDPKCFPAFVDELKKEYGSLGISVQYSEELDKPVQVQGYGDLLNAIRLRSPKDHISNLCLGHVIGQSLNCDLYEDIRRGVSRIAFAPETVEPEGSHKVVCHNCGCGC